MHFGFRVYNPDFEYFFLLRLNYPFTSNFKKIAAHFYKTAPKKDEIRVGIGQVRSYNETYQL